MKDVSLTTTALFVLLVIVVATAFALAAGPMSGAAGESRSSARRWSLAALLLLGLWLVPPALLARSGWLSDFAALPPPVLLMMGPLTLGVAMLAWSPLGTRLAFGLGWAALIGFQAFRVPVELLLHRLYVEGAIPVQMTYVGYNFDVLSGLSAALLGLWAWRGQPPRWLILCWNAAGLGLLLTIVTIAVLSTPLPIRQFHGDPANVLPAHFPFVWLPAFLVEIALLGHLLVFRKLRKAQ